jgi:hypothetical protein
VYVIHPPAANPIHDENKIHHEIRTKSNRCAAGLRNQVTSGAAIKRQPPDN